MENMEMVINKVMDKKDGYAYSGDDFVAPTDIMVTITLHEYRELVARNSYTDDEIRRLRKKCEELEKENKELKESSKDKETLADIKVVISELMSAKGKKE